jgi:hypothetical protein
MIMHAWKQAELNKLNGLLIARERHCIELINKYPWLVVKCNLQDVESTQHLPKR